MSELSVAQRKQQLIAEGILLRAEIGGAARQLQTGLHELREGGHSKKLFGYLAPHVFGFFSKRIVSPSAGLQTVLPLLLTGIKMFAKKSPMMNKVWRGVLIAGAVGAMAGFVFKTVRSLRQRQSTPPTYP